MQVRRHIHCAFNIVLLKQVELRQIFISTLLLDPAREQDKLMQIEWMPFSSLHRLRGFHIPQSLIFSVQPAPPQA